MESGMERWLLVGATVAVVLAGALGMQAVRGGRRSRWTLLLMLAAFILQLGVLGIRGEMRGQCPLGDFGEILVFLAWSLTLFYLVVGPAYRISLLGLFTAPVVAVFQVVALAPGLMNPAPERVAEVDPWREAHAAFSVLSYGAFALAAVAGLMFVILNRQLKAHQLGTGLFRNMPPVPALLDSVVRLTWIGVGILAVGIVSGFLMRESAGGAKMVVALVTWGLYFGVMVVHGWRGMTPRRFSMSIMALFAISLLVFAFL